MQSFLDMKTRPIIYFCFFLLFSAGAPAADMPGGLPAVEGEYRGSVKRTKMTLWASLITGPGEERALVLMFFPSAQRQAQVERLRRLTDALLAPGQDRCDLVKAYDRVYRTPQGPGLVMIHGDWEQQAGLELSRFPQGYWMMNDEYIFLRGREYMVKGVKLDPDTGELKTLRLTQTGFIQNFFDNPKLRLERIETATGELQSLSDYAKAKFAALRALDAALEGVPQDSVPPCP